jgi:hypothetical protein
MDQLGRKDQLETRGQLALLDQEALLDLPEIVVHRVQLAQQDQLDHLVQRLQ